MYSKNIFILLIFVTISLIISELWSIIEKNLSKFDISKLSINDIKLVLQFRGVKYKKVFEKIELLDVINETGTLTQYELNSAKTYHTSEGKCNTVSISVIPNEDLFNELVEDSKDSAWILMTIFPKSTTPFSDEHRKKLEEVWCHIQSRYVRFGVNMAVLDCGQLYNLCWDRGFHRSPFVLVLPRGRNKIKDSVDFFIFPYSNDIVHREIKYIQTTVITWLSKKMAHRVNQQLVSNNDNLREDVFKEFPVNFVSIYANKTSIDRMPPTSVSAHSVKFTGRIHFWSGSLDTIPRVFLDQISSRYPNSSSLGHFFVTKNGLAYHYGMKDGQSLSYDSLELFFRDLCPSNNDIFLCSLLIINLIVSFQLSLQSGSLAVRLGYSLWYFLILNLLFCSLFLFLISSVNFDSRFDGVTSLWQKVAISPIGEHIRYLQLTHKLSMRLFGFVWICMSLSITVIVWLRSEVVEPEPAAADESVTISRTPEPWDPEAGHQIAFLDSLGIFNLTLSHRSPTYLSSLLKWSFEMPKRLASRGSKEAASVQPKSSMHEDSEISSDLSSTETGTPKAHSVPRPKWPQNYIFTHSCCICLQSYKQDDILCGLPCWHAFHDSCINQWLDDWAKNDCPQCRWPAYKCKAF